jgi:hypothetical protein
MRRRLIRLGELALFLVAAGFVGWAMSRKGGSDLPAQPGTSPPTVAPKEPAAPFAGTIVQGGGAAFASPILQRWASIYEKTHNVRIDYRDVGADAGVRAAIDRVFLFGFSRGAYTVRALTSLLYMYGLIPAGNESLVPYAIRMLTGVQKTDPKAAFALAREFHNTFSMRSCRPHFVGVWDAVSSVGWIQNPLRLPYTANSPEVTIGRHAMAIDERRAFFRQNLWRLPTQPPPPAAPKPSGPADLKQVWFAGVHCDVGGGYPEAESGLSKIALEWMLAEANEHGIRLDKQRTDQVLGNKGGSFMPPDINAQMHNSLTVPWWPAELVFKKHHDQKTGKDGYRMNLFRRRTILPGASVHESVFTRANYRPKLPSDVVSVSTLPLA